MTLELGGGSAARRYREAARARCNRRANEVVVSEAPGRTSQAAGLRGRSRRSGAHDATGRENGGSAAAARATDHSSSGAHRRERFDFRPAHLDSGNVTAAGASADRPDGALAACEGAAVPLAAWPAAPEKQKAGPAVELRSPKLPSPRARCALVDCGATAGSEHRARWPHPTPSGVEQRACFVIVLGSDAASARA